mgnify:CR=1 FL=1
MILIGENIHVISKNVREALINRNKTYVSELVRLQKSMDYADLNVGPAKGDLVDIYPWLVEIVKTESSLGISFDTTNIVEMKKGLMNFGGNSFINSASLERLFDMTEIALEFGSNLIALTYGTGIPKTADERMEIVFEMYEKFMDMGIPSDRIFFDPLVLPVCVEQSQAFEVLSTIKMIKESFSPAVNTVVGLSNISNGTVERHLINKVFLALLYGVGLDSAIIDARDDELVRVIRMLEQQKPECESDGLLIDLSRVVEDFVDIEEIKFDVNSTEQKKIIKTAKILLNKEIYSHSFTQI